MGAGAKLRNCYSAFDVFTALRYGFVPNRVLIMSAVLVVTRKNISAGLLYRCYADT